MSFQFKELPQQSYLKECFDYNQATGVLRWRIRPDSHFKVSWAAQVFNEHHGGKLAGYVRTDGHCHITLGKYGLFFAHRIIWALVHGSLSRRARVLHIDGDHMNNRIDNLALEIN